MISDPIKKVGTGLKRLEEEQKRNHTAFSMQSMNALVKMLAELVQQHVSTRDLLKDAHVKMLKTIALIIGQASRTFRPEHREDDLEQGLQLVPVGTYVVLDME